MRVSGCSKIKLNPEVPNIQMDCYFPSEIYTEIFSHFSLAEAKRITTVSKNFRKSIKCCMDITTTKTISSETALVRTTLEEVSYPIFNCVVIKNVVIDDLRAEKGISCDCLDVVPTRADCHITDKYHLFEFRECNCLVLIRPHVALVLFRLKPCLEISFLGSQTMAEKLNSVMHVVHFDGSLTNGHHVNSYDHPSNLKRELKRIPCNCHSLCRYDNLLNVVDYYSKTDDEECEYIRSPVYSFGLLFGR